MVIMTCGQYADEFSCVFPVVNSYGDVEDACNFAKNFGHVEVSETAHIYVPPPPKSREYPRFDKVKIFTWAMR